MLGIMLQVDAGSVHTVKYLLITLYPFNYPLYDRYTGYCVIHLCLYLVPSHPLLDT